MSELRELYQQMIMDHNRKPRNFGKPEGYTCEAKGHNPLCGDRVTVYLTIEGDTVKDVHFDGAGCAICMSSASVMTQALKGMSETEAEALYQKFHHLLVDKEPPAETDEGPALGKLKVFAGVRDFPVRVKCATLPWHTFEAAIRDRNEPVTTE